MMMRCWGCRESENEMGGEREKVDSELGEDIHREKLKKIGRRKKGKEQSKAKDSR